MKLTDKHHTVLKPELGQSFRGVLLEEWWRRWFLSAAWTRSLRPLERHSVWAAGRSVVP